MSIYLTDLLTNRPQPIVGRCRIETRVNLPGAKKIVRVVAAGARR
jgi:hypothetical protein